jgi:FMN phosphatase YigB (HAD superfamily)
MLEYINNSLNKKLPLKFMDIWLDLLGECIIKSKEIADTLKYLSEKYELVVLSNWFHDSQEKRLEEMDIKKYLVIYISLKTFLRNLILKVI